MSQPDYSGTMPVVERQRFDVAALEAWMGANVAGFEGPVTVEQFRGGQSNPTFRLTTPGRRYVMRRKPAGKLLPSAHAVDREHRVMTALAATGVPVPRTFGLCTDDAVIGSAFFIMDCVEGRVFWDGTLPGMEPVQRRAIYEEMNRVIVALHQADYAAVGLADYGKPGNYFERQVARWTRQYQASETETIEAMNRLIEWLPRNIPPGDETTIVHGDYRLDNTIFHPTEPRILAVLDWELSTLGHPLADFSYHCMSWHIEQGGPFRGLGSIAHAALGIPSEREYIDLYCRRMGRGPIDPRHWNFYLAYNLFRAAGITQGIMKRVQEGTAASLYAVEAGKKARPMAELGWTFAQRV
ncbi:MAG TPA: phosphotransferase [Usitatibacter sp.]|nr:phosphotransferase [Usitatibacter sp.]